MSTGGNGCISQPLTLALVTVLSHVVKLASIRVVDVVSMSWLPIFFVLFFFCCRRTKAQQLSNLKACLTQTRASNQMELSQGCPVDCDTCVWVRVFHCSLIVVVYKKKEEGKACILMS